METKDELITQLEEICDLIYDRDQAARKREESDQEINRLKHENESLNGGSWYPTNNAQTTKQAIEAELQSKKVRRRVPCIIVLAISGSICALFGSASAGVAIVFFLIAIVALILLILVQKNGKNWSDEQIEQLLQAEKKDAENKALNEGKRTELRKKNSERIAELSKQREEAQKTWAKAENSLMQYPILSYKDRNWTTAHGLLEALQSHRANDLQEAFRILDEQQHREQMLRAQREANWAHQRMQRQILKQMEENEAHRQAEVEQARRDQLRRDREQAEHNREMERLQWKQIDELEKKRKEDEFYRNKL